MMLRMQKMEYIFRTKPVSTLPNQTRNNLKRVLGGRDLIAMGIGAIIGTGIFVLSGVAAARFAGPAVILSFVLAGITAALAALVYSELTAMFPAAGSAYTYTYNALGEIVAWLIGWNLVLEYTVAAAAVALGWSGYMLDMLQPLGIRLPAFLTTSPFSGGVINLPPVLIIAVVVYLVAAGTQQSNRANKVVVVMKLAAIGLFLALGFSRFNPANWRPFLPFGAGGIFRGASVIFFAYIGFDAVATAAEEVRHPQRDLPVGILGALLISTVLYLAVASVLTGMVRYDLLDTSSPVTTALILRGLPWAAALVSVGALAGLTSVLLVNFFAQSRILFAMSRDGLLPPQFSLLHPRFQTPALGVLIVGVVAAALSSLLPIYLIAELANIGTLSAFTMVSLGVIVLRHTRPDLPRPFRVPLMPYLPLLSIAASAYLMYNLPALTWYRFGFWVALGLMVYFTYSAHHSVLNREPGQEPPPEPVPRMPGRARPTLPQPAFKRIPESRSREAGVGNQKKNNERPKIQ
jgi:APA family basic amino acid/polyamine antiporter